MPTPTNNPKQVRIICPLVCEQHNFTLNGVYDVLPGYVDDCKDNNGFNIYVMSPEWKHSIWLSSKEYELVNQPTDK